MQELMGLNFWTKIGVFEQALCEVVVSLSLNIHNVGMDIVAD